MMNVKYKLGWPLGKFVARLGIPTLVRINVIRDDEAGVFVGTSEDLVGLVLEAETLDGLINEAKLMIPCLLNTERSEPSRREIIPSIRYDDCHA